jgi:hypothetical protein
LSTSSPSLSSSSPVLTEARSLELARACSSEGIRGQARAAASIPNLGYAHCPARPPPVVVGPRARVPRKPARARTSFPPTSGQTARQRGGGEATVWNPASGDRFVLYPALPNTRKGTEGHSRAFQRHSRRNRERIEAGVEESMNDSPSVLERFFFSEHETTASKVCRRSSSEAKRSLQRGSNRGIRSSKLRMSENR